MDEKDEINLNDLFDEDKESGQKKQEREQEEYEKQVCIHPGIAFAVSSKRNINVLCKKTRKGNVPAFPEINQIHSLINSDTAGNPKNNFFTL